MGSEHALIFGIALLASGLCIPLYYYADTENIRFPHDVFYWPLFILAFIIYAGMVVWMGT